LRSLSEIKVASDPESIRARALKFDDVNYGGILECGIRGPSSGGNGF